MGKFGNNLGFGIYKPMTPSVSVDATRTQTPIVRPNTKVIVPNPGMQSGSKLIDKDKLTPKQLDSINKENAFLAKAKKDSGGLKEVYPEFDLLTMGAGILNSLNPAKFMKNVVNPVKNLATDAKGLLSTSSRKLDRLLEKPVISNGKNVYLSELGDGFKGFKMKSNAELSQIKKSTNMSIMERNPYSDKYETYVRENFIKQSGAKYENPSFMYDRELGPFSIAKNVQTEKLRKGGIKAFVPLTTYATLGVADAMTNNIASNTLYRKAGIYNKDLLRKDTVIDLTNRKMDYARNGETKDGNLILGGEFIENSNNTVKAKKEWSTLNSSEKFGDRGIELKSIKNFYGIEEGLLKIGSLNEFADETQIVPIRFSSDKIIKNATIGKGTLSLLDEKGEKIFNNTTMGGKFILYDKTTGNKEFVYSNQPENAKKVIDQFLSKNKNAQYLTLDNGRYSHYLENKDGLKPEDFVKYSSYDFKRPGKTGYNLVLK